MLSRRLNGSEANKKIDSFAKEQEKKSPPTRKTLNIQREAKLILFVEKINEYSLSQQATRHTHTHTQTHKASDWLLVGLQPELTTHTQTRIFWQKIDDLGVQQLLARVYVCVCACCVLLLLLLVRWRVV